MKRLAVRVIILTCLGGCGEPEGPRPIPATTTSKPAAGENQATRPARNIPMH